MRWQREDEAPGAMKFQAPTSKLQRSSKDQTSNASGSLDYPAVSSDAYFLSDAPPQDGPSRHAFDLEERTARFGEGIIRFCKKIPHGPDNNRLINQLVGCGTSVGANYCEANEGVSKKDFKNTIGRWVKEAKETKFFLRMIAASEPKLAEEARHLYREAKELHLIFGSIFRK
jgi:four helix bundle protein